MAHRIEVASHHQPPCGAFTSRQRQRKIAGGIDMMLESEILPDPRHQIVRTLFARAEGISRDPGHVHAVVVDLAE